MTQQTHTFAILEVSRATFLEIKERLEAAGHGHSLVREDGEPLLDMHGLALKALPPGSNMVSLVETT